MDERVGRETARYLGVRYTVLFGVLVEARRKRSTPPQRAATEGYPYDSQGGFLKQQLSVTLPARLPPTDAQGPAAQLRPGQCGSDDPDPTVAGLPLR